MISNKFALVGTGIVAGLVGPAIGRFLAKQVVKAGLFGETATKQVTGKIKEEIIDIINEIEHEKHLKASVEHTPDHEEDTSKTAANKTTKTAKST